MRVCDLVADYIYGRGIEDVFMISGGGLMFLTDGLACHAKINKICCHHEQAAAMAAVAYAKYKGIGCAYVTTGCGGTNAVTGVLNAWQDNTACIFISGQCKIQETLGYRNLPIRQVGVQEADIVSIVCSITKYAVMVTHKADILYHLEKAFYLAGSGRPGPVWLDIPLDIQSAEIDGGENLRHFDPSELQEPKTAASAKEIDGLAYDLNHAQRPVIIAGHGVRLAGAVEQFYSFVHKYHIPVVFSRLGTDVMPTTDDLNIGRIGNKGTRAGNFAVQNADLVISIGSRLSVSSTGQEYGYFAREAKVIAIDIDKYEHLKNTIHIEQIIQADAKNVMDQLLQRTLQKDFCMWAKQCLGWKQRYPVCLQEYYDDSQGINMYLFIEELSKHLKEDSAVVTDAGSAVYVPAQGIQTYDKRQRYITSGGQAEMGFTLPAAIGVCAARNGQETIGITGDGSFQMNIQELQTLVYHRYPVKLFIWNNDGYLSIRATQNKFFNGRFIGTDSASGVSFPDVGKIADAYGIAYYKIETLQDIEMYMPQIMKKEGPVLCEVKIIRDQEVIPSVSSKRLADGRLVSAPIEDMYPFLPRDEFYKNMIIKPIAETE